LFFSDQQCLKEPKLLKIMNSQAKLSNRIKCNFVGFVADVQRTIAQATLSSGLDAINVIKSVPQFSQVIVCRLVPTCFSHVSREIKRQTRDCLLRVCVRLWNWNSLETSTFFKL